MVKVLADIYIWAGMILQVGGLVASILWSGPMPLLYGIAMCLLNGFGIFYGADKKDWRFSFACFAVLVLYIVKLILN